MAPPDMTRASDTQDQTETRRQGIRGWFQPTGRPAADTDGGGKTETVPPYRADAHGHGTGTSTGAGPGDTPATVSDETTVFPRIPVSGPESSGPEAGLPDET